MSAAGTPLADAFYMPADGCRLARVWMPWPDDPKLHGAMSAAIRAAAMFQPVSIVATAAGAASARQAFGEVTVLPRAALRLKDIGPTFLVDGKGGAAAVDWRFNGWGGRGGDADAGFAHALLGVAEVRRFRAPLTLEASCMAADGRGTVLALKSAVFDPKRNPRLTELEAFAAFRNWLSASRVVWVEQPHKTDALNTDVRAVAAFVRPGLAAISDDDDETAAALKRARDASGKNLDIAKLPAARLPYTTFMPLNGGLLVPAYGTDDDQRAADALAELFPKHVITPVPMAELGAAGASLVSLAIPHPARLLERDRATILPRSAWDAPVPDVEAFLQKYVDMADAER